jgi:FkbM family methyltransferase
MAEAQPPRQIYALMKNVTALARRALDALAVRFSEAEKRLNELRLVSSPPLQQGRSAGLVVSQFNPKWLDELQIQPRTILDVGALDAGVSIFLRQHFPSASIFAIEADPKLFTAIEKNAKPFDVSPINVALCERDGRIRWYPAASGRGQGSILAARRSGHHLPPIEVACTRLDTLCTGRRIDAIDFVHMDVEGAEYEVLLGLGALRPRAIFLETIWRELWIGARSAHRLLSQMGYCLAGDFRQDRLYVHHSVL